MLHHKHHHHHGFKNICSWRPGKQDIVILAFCILIGFLVVSLLSSLQNTAAIPASTTGEAEPLSFKPGADEIKYTKDNYLQNF